MSGRMAFSEIKRPPRDWNRWLSDGDVPIFDRAEFSFGDPTFLFGADSSFRKLPSRLLIPYAH